MNRLRRNLLASAVALVFGALVFVGGAMAVEAEDSTELGKVAFDLEAPSSIPRGVLEGLRGQHIEIELASERLVDSGRAIEKAVAIDLAAKEFGLNGTTPASSASLVSLSTPKMGSPGAGGNAKGLVEPLYVARLAWLITFEGVANPVYGSIGTRKNVRPEATESEGTMATFIGAEDSAYLFSLVF